MREVSLPDVLSVRALLLEGATRQALGASSRLLDAAPDDLETHLLRADCLGAAGAWDRAVLARRELLRRWPDLPGAELALARSEVEAGDARPALDRLASMAADDAEQLDLRARAWTLLDELDEAVRAQRARLAQRPTDPAARRALARALSRVGAHEEAGRELERAGASATPHALDAAAAEVEARRRGPEAEQAWWAAAGADGTLPPELAPSAMARHLAADEPLAALHRLAAFGAAPPLSPVVPLVVEAVARAARTADGRAGLVTAIGELSLLPSALWSRVADGLIRGAQFDGAKALVAALPESGGSAARLSGRLEPIIAELPDEVELPAELQPGAQAPSVVRVARPGATAVAIFTTPLASRFLHARVAARGLDVVHIGVPNDPHYLLAGIRGLAEGWPASIEALRARLLADGPRRIYVAGESGRAYTAVRLGLALGADGVLALAPPTTFRGPVFHGVTYGARLLAEVPHMLGDMRPLLAEAPSPPRISLWFAGEVDEDRRHADRLTGLPTVHLHAVPGARRHIVIFDLLAQGLVECVLDEWLAPRADA